MTQQRKWFNPALWFVAILLINIIWANVAGQEAPYEVNTREQTEPYREIEVAALAGMSKAIPSRFDVSFFSEVVDDGAVGYTVYFENTTEVYTWSGQLSDDVPTWEAALNPGMYTVHTHSDNDIVVDQTLHLQPFDVYRIHGHLLMTILLIGLAYGEVLVRRVIKQVQNSRASKPAPAAPPLFKPVAEGMPDIVAPEEGDIPWREPIR